FSCDLFRRIYRAPSLAKALRREVVEFDLVHLHSVFLWPTWAAARLAREVNVPYLISPRGMLVKELIERRSRFAKSAWIGLIERSNFESASAIHVTSELEEQELRRFNWRLPQVAMIPNGVEDLESAHGNPSRDVAELASHQPLMLFLGRIS